MKGIKKKKERPAAPAGGVEDDASTETPKPIAPKGPPQGRGGPAPVPREAPRKSPKEQRKRGF